MDKKRYGNAVILTGKGSEKAFEELLNTPKPDFTNLQRSSRVFEKRILKGRKQPSVRK